MAALWFVAPAALQADWFSDERALMGTQVRVELWADNARQARPAISAALAEIARIDAAMSVYREDSEVSRINRDAAQAPVAVSAELYELLERAVGMFELTGGAFDVTYAAAGVLYDFRNARRPDDKVLAEALRSVSSQLMVLDRGERTVQFVKPGVRIDLGGIAKGYAVERATAALQRRGIQHALVSAGGDARFLGDRKGRSWRVAIRDPRNTERSAAVLSLHDEAISTSGDYERFFIEDGIRYHHILDPATGRSSDAVTSVSVIGPDATISDALATGLFVLGVTKGQTILKYFPAYDAVFIDRQGNLHFSKNISTLSE
ncbi:MAG: FAD:protein FMN transferase [Gammaproteobacteria bacterium]|nr:FAD:protein FMN transferase [Gammaproteobacteria bacterium]